jgi:hypothetical protein
MRIQNIRVNGRLNLSLHGEEHCAAVRLEPCRPESLGRLHPSRRPLRGLLRMRRSGFLRILQLALNALIEPLDIDHDPAMPAIPDAFLVVEGFDPEFDIAPVDLHDLGRCP